MSFTQSLLFVPATRPDRFARAIASGADAVCFDLEDAVPLDRKIEAREAAAAFLSQRDRTDDNTPRIGVRINAIEDGGDADLLALRDHADFVMIPKAGSGDDIRRIADRTPGPALWPLVETASGLRHVWEIAEAPGVAGVLFGAFDYAADVGCERAWEPLLFARSQIAAACAAARIEALDSPSGEMADLSAIETEARQARALGFGGKACIHPDQIAPVHRAFAPTPDQLHEAAEIVAALDAAGGGAAQRNGRLIERPVALAARRILSRERTQ